MKNRLIGFVGQVRNGVTVNRVYHIDKYLTFADDNNAIRDARLFSWSMNIEKCKSSSGLNYADHISEGVELKDDDREEYIVKTNRLKARSTPISVEVSQLIIARDILNALIAKASI